ncbi:MAG: HEAT repeat domain-containing protein [Planctomycetota bacterium]
MRRRVWLTAMLLTAVGCSGKSTKSRPKTTKSSRPQTTKSSRPARKHPKGPKTMGGLLLDAYIEDLKSPAGDKRINAARELANMGPNAKKAVPLLEKMATDKDGKVSAAAKQALVSIRK